MSHQSESITTYVKTQAARVEQHLRQVWQHLPNPIQENLLAAMDYSLLAGGKRLRPTLMFAAAESLGCGEDAVIGAALAVEMIHTYSLIHDDLPAMDDDDLRRGKPTNHVVYGEATAILAGDGLLTHAFHVLSELAQGQPERAVAVLQVVREMSAFAGPAGMVGGQAMDMAGGVQTVEQLSEIHRRKTGDLIVFSLRAAGILCQANARQLAALETYGRNIGLAFQIQDDVLDLIGEQDKIGKPVKSDEVSNKVTYPMLIGFEQSEQLIKQLTEEANEALLHAGFVNPSRLIALGQWLMKRDH
jgi:geranylgeranyl diphosphate synthase type II